MKLKQLTKPIKILRMIAHVLNPRRIERQRKLRKARLLNASFIGRMPGINAKMIIRPRMYLSVEYAGESYARGTIFEPGTIRYMKKNVKASMVALDIGANVGYFTLLLSHLVGSQGKVIAFEPGRYQYELLQQNVQINGLTNVTIYNVAVSDIPGRATFYEGPEGFDGFSSLVEVSDPGFRGVQFIKREVGAVTIDDALMKEKIFHVDFIKIDVEGAELLVIRGMKRLLDNHNEKVTILFEAEDRWTTRFGYSVRHLVREVENSGFRCFWLDNRGRLVEIDWHKSQASNMVVAKR